MKNGINERVSLLLASEKNKKNSNRNQKALALALEIPEGTLSGWLLKGRAIPAEHIIAICEFFDVSTDWLLTGEERSEGSVHVSGSVSGGSVVQGVNRGMVIVRNGHERVLSEEAGELLRLYESLDVKRRIELLNKAFALESEMQKLK